MKITALLTVSFFGLVAWAGNRVSHAGDARNVNSVNGSVTAKSGETYDTLSAVNGDVNVERGATAQTVRTVNGEVVIESATKVGNASTVNGEIDIAADATVTGDASTVNGGLKIGKRAEVGGNVSTVSGEIELAGAQVGGTVSTVNGDIDLTDGALIRGGVLVRENKSAWNTRIRSRCTSARPAWSKATCASIGRSNCASRAARRSAR